jgi:hypothetical protein
MLPAMMRALIGCFPPGIDQVVSIVKSVRRCVYSGSVDWTEPDNYPLTHNEMYAD